MKYPCQESNGTAVDSDGIKQRVDFEQRVIFRLYFGDSSGVVVEMEVVAQLLKWAFAHHISNGIRGPAHGRFWHSMDPKHKLNENSFIYAAVVSFQVLTGPLFYCLCSAYTFV